MDRFHVAGWRRWCFVEPLSECLTLGNAGLLVLLALAIPAFRETSDDDWLKKSELAVTFLDRYGNEVGTRGIRHNDAIPLDEFPDHLIKATLATGDRRFYDHFGIDPSGLGRALTANARAGGVVQGGSSITQQLAKNLFLSNERTIERKVKEAFLAIWLETRLTKNEILKLYLDRAYMGGGAFGVDAAAQYYFNKSARDVNLSEAAMLAGLFKAPTRFAPHVNLPAARARANVVLDNLVEAGMMTEGQVFGARRNPATALDRRDERVANYYLDFAFDEMKKLVATFPKSLHERVFVVRTGLDVNLQRESENAVESMIRQYGNDYKARQAAAVVLDLDGSIRAMVGGRDYGQSQFNRATDALRQPGSSFKPYVYATALSNGFKPTSIVVDAPICLGNWCPQNYSHSFSGPMPLIEARSGSGDIVWRFDRDGKKPEQVLRPQVALDMNFMMNKVVEEGTGKRAILDGVKAAGKTGTTNAYRDAWFVGFTGNYVCGVWFGNDDYTTMNQMTGGSLPAQTWHDIMAFAHQGVELKPIPGLGPQATGRQQVAE